MEDAIRPMGADRPFAVADWLRSHWFLVIPALCFVVPSLVALARTVWTSDQGAQGPILLATGLWLLWREGGGALTLARPGRPAWVALGCGVAAAAYLTARIVGMVWLEWLGVSIMLITLLYSYIGGPSLKALWFPILYLLFLVPPPFSLMAAITRGLKLWISASAVEILTALGFQVASSGTTLYIDQYELLVAAACSGMNSLFSLLAIGLFYIFLRHRADWRYAMLLALLVLPIAIFTNLARVVFLLLVTHYFGDAVAQGMLHEASGMIMFFLALLALLAVDALLTPLRRRFFGGGQPA